MTLVLKLRTLPAEKVVGIYTIGGVPNRMPARALFLWPEAADAFLEHVAPYVVVSDIYRSAESSLDAVKSGRGALPPGKSAHGFGLATDLDVARSMKKLGAKTKKELDDFMEAPGFYCHRRDHRITDLRGESHHYNFLGAGTVISPKVEGTSGYIEAKIQELYGAELTLDSMQAQGALKKLRLYSGELDGKFGPLSKTATRVFQRAWGLPENGTLDKNTQRTLAFVACEREII